MLSTIHKIHMDESFIERIRRCPRNTSTNAANARAVFNGNPTAPLKIPKLTDDYNHNKNGVDLSDQFRSYYCTQLTVTRTWIPLFFWILDTTIVNSYRIYTVRKGTLTHKEYRFKLALTLIASGALNQHHSMMKKHRRECDATSDNHPRKTMHVAKHTELPPAVLSPVSTMANTPIPENSVSFAATEPLSSRTRATRVRRGQTGSVRIARFLCACQKPVTASRISIRIARGQENI